MQDLSERPVDAGAQRWEGIVILVFTQGVLDLKLSS